MLDVIRKHEYFQWWDTQIASRSFTELKSIQDAWILSRLGNISAKRIAEVGGGRSRVLEKLKASNECWNIEKFEGVGAGPRSIQPSPGITLVDAYLGDFDPRLPDAHFDVVFSVSVVEHVPPARLQAFFADCARILKPGGILLHAIDLYVFDQPNPRNEVVDAYRRVADDPSLNLHWIEPPTADSSITFRCDFASNPDMTLAQWNQIAPSLRAQREVAQSISLKAAWTKAA